MPQVGPYSSPMTMKTIATRALVAVMAMGSLLLAVPGTASAAPAPRLGLLGEDIWVVGNNAYCNGAIHVGVDTNPAKRGQATVFLTSRGFTGIEPEWSRRPECKVNVAIGYYQGAAYREKVVPLTLGRNPQAPVRVDLRNVGQGLQLMSFTTHPLVNKGVSYYVIVP